ncbi:hypothetical protein Ssi02_31180 [Sinosporangium siamense]|uniref:Uncharacterized protein n=2 Tax=Sinosporangium siamense TaxID=1367973 RepID=A0A919RFR2_9ACTN|nr:hypothetical protein Ssi02_31180 [Sinosporangium siamense]
MHAAMKDLPRRTEQAGPRHVPAPRCAFTYAPESADWPQISGDPTDMALLIRLRNALRSLR